MQAYEVRYAELEARIDKLLDLRIKQDQERSEALSLIEALCAENQSLRFELDKCQRNSSQMTAELNGADKNSSSYRSRLIAVKVASIFV